jgi:hypothetical protein
MRTGLRPKLVSSASAIGALLRGKKRWALVALGGTLVVGAGMALGGSKPPPGSIRTGPIEVHAQPIAAFDKMNPEKTRFGKLVWRGGLVLTSPSEGFGGLSGIALGPDGKSLIAVSDAGAWLTGTLTYEGGRPTALRSVRLGPIRSPSGKPLTRYQDRDAEGVILQEGTAAKGEVLISFERNHRIGRFAVDAKSGLLPPTSYLPMPSEKSRLSKNSGLEAIALLCGGPYKGSLVAIAERFQDKSGRHTGWIWVKGKPRAFHLTNDGDFNVTDAASLPDGSLLVLERRFRWSEGVKARLRYIKSDQLRPGAVLRGQVLLDAGMGQEIDNMEGLAVHADSDGAIVVTMISDDNFNRGLQRTVLLQFALKSADLASATLP